MCGEKRREGHSSGGSPDLHGSYAYSLRCLTLHANCEWRIVKEVVVAASKRLRDVGHVHFSAAPGFTLQGYYLRARAHLVLPPGLNGPGIYNLSSPTSKGQP